MLKTVLRSALLAAIAQLGAVAEERSPVPTTVGTIPVAELFDQTQWDACTADDAVTTCKRKSRVGQAVEVMVMAEMPSTRDSVMALVRDAGAYCDWVPTCRNAELIQGGQAHFFDYAMRAKTPFPFEDRLIVSRVHVMAGDGGDLYTIDETLPANVTRLRGFPPPINFGARRLRETDDGSVEVSLYTAINPGGGVPLGLTHSSVRQNAADALRSMAAELAKRDEAAPSAP